MKYKVLKFKSVTIARGVGRYAVPMIIEGEVLEWAGCGIPVLMNDETTIEDLKSLYPTLDFNEVVLLTVTLTEGDDLLNEVDVLLALLEDVAHGAEGKRITEMRGKIQTSLK